MEVDAVSQTVQAMTEILKMITTQSIDIAEKLIKINVQNTIGVFQDDQMGNIVDIYT